MKMVHWKMEDGSPVQGDLRLERLSVAEGESLSRSTPLKRSETGAMRLLEGEVSGHHHTIVGKYTLAGVPRFHDGAMAADRIASDLKGNAILYEDRVLAGHLPWLLRQDLMIGFLVIEGGPVDLEHPEHDTIRLPEGVYYVGRQIESAGAEERVVAD